MSDVEEARTEMVLQGLRDDVARLEVELENDKRHTKSLMDEFLRTAAERDAMREAAKVADGLDVTDWQRGYRACSERVLAAGGQSTEATDG